MIWACFYRLATYLVCVVGRSLDSSVVQGRVFRDAWFLVFFSILAIFVTATLNSRNSVWCYWIHFISAGIADTGFLFFVLPRGSRRVRPSILGPVFWG